MVGRVTPQHGVCDHTVKPHGGVSGRVWVMGCMSHTGKTHKCVSGPCNSLSSYYRHMGETHGFVSRPCNLMSFD